MDITQVLRKSIQALEDANVPENLREVALAKLLDYQLNASVGHFTGPHPTANAEKQPVAEQEYPLTVTNTAKALGIGPEQVERVFGFDGERLDVIISPRHLTQNNAGATKELALLYCAGVQASGLGEWVHIDSIRHLVEEFGRYDGSNFSRAVSSMKGDLWIRNSGSKRELKATRDGLERARELILQLLGTEDG